MSNLEKVREALAFAQCTIRSGEEYTTQCEHIFESAKSALQSHEQEVAALVEALTLALPYVEEAMNDPGYKSGAVAKVLKIILAALRPFTGDEK